MGFKVVGYDSSCISSFGSRTQSSTVRDVVELSLIANDGRRTPIQAIVVPHITNPIGRGFVTNPDDFPHLRGLRLAHAVTGSGPFRVDILIGADYYWSIVKDRIIRGPGPVAMDSEIGYLLSGPIRQEGPSAGSAVLTVHDDAEEATFDLSRFWTIESLGIFPESDVINMKDSYTRDHVSFKDGRYIVGLPWKQSRPSIDSNLNVCQGRTRAMVRRLSRTPELFAKYGKIIQDQIERGFIEEVIADDRMSGIHVINHHPVIKDSLTTPIRIVYDCSCKTRDGVSLNDLLESGPPLQNDIVEILIRFRIHRIGVVSDIEKAFHQVLLVENERDFFRFLYPSDFSNPESQFKTYRFKVLPFGASCSPFILNAVIQKHLALHPCSTSTDLQRNIYVDNIITGFATTEEAVEYYKQATSIMAQAGMNLKIWSTSSKQVSGAISSEEDADLATVKVLGLVWDVATDTLKLPGFSLASSIRESTTKREILRGIASVFDPLGLFSPITIRAKILIQKLWEMEFEWDDPLPVELTEQWRMIAQDLVAVTEHQISRSYFTAGFTSVKTLHVFVDASQRAYGAVGYLSDGDSASFVISKSRVAPLKKLTLPQLELMAALLGAVMAMTIKRALGAQGLSVKVHLWSDAQVVLHWLSSSKAKVIFVANRVTRIKSLTSELEGSWRYCPTHQNPADLLTRGISVTEFSESQLWKVGPDWLGNENKWPVWTATQALVLGVEDTHESDVKFEVVTASISKIVDHTGFSKLSRLLRVTAWITRFVRNCQPGKYARIITPLTAAELTAAEKRWIRAHQGEHFTEELTYFKSGQATRRPGLVRQLDLLLHTDGIIRCGGRLENIEMAETVRHPILIAKSNHFSKLVILSVHFQMHHGGVNTTVAAIRQMYWIPSARQQTRAVLRQSVTCLKISGPAYQAQDHAALPGERVSGSEAFAVTGVDLTGAYFVKNDSIPGREEKVYIALFTCAASRAVHLELVEDLSASSFIEALRRFSNRRSTPRILISDNATNFTSAAEDLKVLFESTQVSDFCSQKRIQWRFIVKRAPWHGGFWERLVGLTKSALKRALGRSKVTASELRTIITDVEAVMNDRPLTYISPDFKDREPLTPSHLVYGRRIVGLPLRTTEDDDDEDFRCDARPIELSKRVARQAKVIHGFWKFWQLEYLTALREHHQGTTGPIKETIRVGDVVLIHNESSRMQWKMAIVESLIRSADGIARSATVRIGSNISSRPITKLYPLEVNENEEVNSIKPESIPESVVEPITPKGPALAAAGTQPELIQPPGLPRDQHSVGSRPVRKAAERARQLIAQFAKEEEEE